MQQNSSLSSGSSSKLDRRKKYRYPFDFFRVGSIFQWTIAIFFLITLPLVITLIFSVRSIQDYTDHSHRTLFKTIEISKLNQDLLDSLLVIDRSIRQFQILEDHDLFDDFKQHHLEFVNIASTTKAEVLPENLKLLLMTLSENEEKLYNQIKKKEPNKKLKEEVIEEKNANKLTEEDIKGYFQLRATAQKLVTESNSQVRIETESLSELAKVVRKQVTNSALISVLLALTLGFLLLYLINKPIRNIKKAIYNLGHAQFDKRIFIKGPSDLRELGKHLEWLRIKLTQLENSKQFFIKTISHELKTPLATLTEGTELLQDEVVGELNREQHKIIELLQIANLRLNGLIENLLEYQKVTSTQAKINYSQFNLTHLIKQICKDYQLLLNSKQVNIEFEAKPVELIADRDKMRIIVSNLFSNALKFSPHGGQILILLNIIKNSLHILVADQGPGITKEQLPHIFTEFYKQETPKTWKIKGSGLGLNLVNEYVKAHHGFIKTLPPDARYCGAHFLIILPLNPNKTLYKKPNKHKPNILQT